MTDGIKMKYFVLCPTSGDDIHALASRQAMLAYALAVKDTFPILSQQLSEWVEHLDLTDGRHVP